MMIPLSLAARGGLRSVLRGALAAVLIGTASTAGASLFTPVSQLREVRSETVDATTGYTCLGGGGGPPLPGCPTDLGTTTATDVHGAPDFGAFDAVALTAGGSAAQTSAITATTLAASGQSSATASMSELSDPCCILVLRSVDPETTNGFSVTISVPAASDFTLVASGWVEHPDPSYPVIGQGALAVSLTGPGGSVGSFSASFDPSCSSSPEFGICRVEPAPLVLSGTLQPGSYTLDIDLDVSSAGSWLPSVGSIGGYAAGGYAVELALIPPAVPVLSPAALGASAALLGALGAAAARRTLRPR